MESCFGTLKTELVHQACYKTRDAAQHDLFAYTKDTTIVSGFIPPSDISPQNRQSAKPLNPGSTKSGEGHESVTQIYLTDRTLPARRNGLVRW
jgi:hypothetical protein